jgi:hypothetical protein
MPFLRFNGAEYGCTDVTAIIVGRGRQMREKQTQMWLSAGPSETHPPNKFCLVIARAAGQNQAIMRKVGTTSPTIGRAI